MSDGEPSVSPRLAASIDLFSVEFEPGHADLGMISVHDAFACDFKSMFRHSQNLDAFTEYCQKLASRPDVSARAVEEQALRAEAAPSRASAASFSFFAPPKGGLKPYEFGADGSSSTARLDEKNKIAGWAAELV